MHMAQILLTLKRSTTWWCRCSIRIMWWKFNKIKLKIRWREKVATIPSEDKLPLTSLSKLFRNLK
jgi:hypothetical protein